MWDGGGQGGDVRRDGGDGGLALHYTQVLLPRQVQLSQARGGGRGGGGLDVSGGEYGALSASLPLVHVLRNVHHWLLESHSRGDHRARAAAGLGLGDIQRQFVGARPSLLQTEAVRVLRLNLVKHSGCV